jgi:O-antigen/teichoic acid export membrane protein
MGKSKFIMYATLSTATLNIILNFILIPIFGIVGAAIASASSLFLINIVKLLKLYSLSGVQPISKNLLKPTLITSLIILIPFWLFQKTTIIRWELLIILLISFYLIYLLVFLVSKSLDKEDLNLLNMIQTKPGGNIQKIKRFLSRFI